MRRRGEEAIREGVFTNLGYTANDENVIARPEVEAIPHVGEETASPAARSDMHQAIFLGEGKNALASSHPRLTASSPLLVIVGPTAVGKTAFSLQIAQDYNGEIISADSRQIYRGLDIGAAKATPEQQALVPHHLLDVVPPDQILTLAEFQEQAYVAIAAIHARQRLPILVGGTGQWVQAVVEGWGVPRVPPDPELRAALEAEATAVGPAAFHARLAVVDPEAAQKLDPRNVRRVIRALEVYHKTGIPISQHQQKNAPPYQICQLGLTMPREALYQRIDQRIDRMLELGLVAEVERLVAAGYSWDLPAMSGLGYKQIGYYLRGELNLEEAVALIKKETRRYVRQQYNWFRLDDPRIKWVEVGQEPEREYQEIKCFLDEAIGEEKNKK